MFRKNYKVTGEDVDDFMVMEDKAYHLYTIASVKSFLQESKNSAYPLKNININAFQKQLVFHKNLMFTQQFFVKLDTVELGKNSFNIKNRFFNADNELCACIEITIPKNDNRVFI